MERVGPPGGGGGGQGGGCHGATLHCRGQGKLVDDTGLGFVGRAESAMVPPFTVEVKVR